MHTCPSLPGTEYRSCSQSLRTSPVHTPEKRPMPGKEERERTKGRLPLTSNRALPTQDSHWSFKLQVYFIYVAPKKKVYFLPKCCKDKFTAFTVNTHALNKHFLLLNNLLLLWMSHNQTDPLQKRLYWKCIKKQQSIFLVMAVRAVNAMNVYKWHWLMKSIVHVLLNPLIKSGNLNASVVTRTPLVPCKSQIDIGWTRQCSFTLFTRYLLCAMLPVGGAGLCQSVQIVQVVVGGQVLLRRHAEGAHVQLASDDTLFKWKTRNTDTDTHADKHTYTHITVQGWNNKIRYTLLIPDGKYMSKWLKKPNNHGRSNFWKTWSCPPQHKLFLNTYLIEAVSTEIIQTIKQHFFKDGLCPPCASDWTVC